MKLKELFEDVGEPKPFTVKLKKGLSKEEAWKAAIKNPSKDFRGMKSYDPKTGKAVLI